MTPLWSKRAADRRRFTIDVAPALLPGAAPDLVETRWRTASADAPTIEASGITGAVVEVRLSGGTPDTRHTLACLVGEADDRDWLLVEVLVLPAVPDDGPWVEATYVLGVGAGRAHPRVSLSAAPVLRTDERIADVLSHALRPVPDDGAALPVSVEDPQTTADGRGIEFGLPAVGGLTVDSLPAAVSLGTAQVRLDTPHDEEVEMPFLVRARPL